MDVRALAFQLFVASVGPRLLQLGQDEQLAQAQACFVAAEAFLMAAEAFAPKPPQQPPAQPPAPALPQG